MPTETTEILDALQSRSVEPQNVPILVPEDSGLCLSERTFARLCALNPELRLERSAKKELIVMTPASSNSGRRGSRIVYQLVRWDEDEMHGVAFDGTAGFTLPNGAIRNPDAAWISRPRWDALSREDQDRFAHLAPDFVVEVCPPSDRISVVRDKMCEYITQGVRLGWLIDPKTELAVIYRAGREPEALIKPASLSGEDVLPGFVLDMKPLWQ
jgi:Uma2 family endonuclease